MGQSKALWEVDPQEPHTWRLRHRAPLNLHEPWFQDAHALGTVLVAKPKGAADHGAGGPFLLSFSRPKMPPPPVVVVTAVVVLLLPSKVVVVPERVVAGATPRVAADGVGKPFAAVCAAPLEAVAFRSLRTPKGLPKGLLMLLLLMLLSLVVVLEPKGDAAGRRGPPPPPNGEGAACVVTVPEKVVARAVSDDEGGGVDEKGVVDDDDSVAKVPKVLAEKGAIAQKGRRAGVRRRVVCVLTGCASCPAACLCGCGGRSDQHLEVTNIFLQKELNKSTRVLFFDGMSSTSQHVSIFSHVL